MMRFSRWVMIGAGGILTERVTLNGYLLGGYSGSQFLVQAVGLVQPAARSGCVCPGVTICVTSKADPRNQTIKYRIEFSHRMMN